MANIHNLKELNKLKRDLKHNDHVCFKISNKIIKYKVTCYLLTNLDGYNDQIFNILKINKRKIAKEAYGYCAYGAITSLAQWPKSKASDYPALTRLVKNLYELLEKKQVKYKVGDKIKIKTWEQMKKQYGLDKNKDIDINCEYRFHKKAEKQIKKLKTKRIVTIKKTGKNKNDGYRVKEVDWLIADNMIECLIKPEPILSRFEILDL